MSADRIEALSRSLADSTSRRSLLRLLGVGVAGTAVASTAVTRIGLQGVQAKTYHKLHNITVTGRDGKKRFRGKLSVVDFKPNSSGTGIVAIAKLTGKVTDENGKQRVSKDLKMPVSLPGLVGAQAQQATCEILDLIIRPIDLNLLGLHLHIDTIHVNLTATQGGGLLGDLLCAIANLLNGGNPLGQLAEIANLLRQILAVLRSL
jgi:hypothetical protein